MKISIDIDYSTVKARVLMRFLRGLISAIIPFVVVFLADPEFLQLMSKYPSILALIPILSAFLLALDKYLREEKAKTPSGQ